MLIETLERIKLQLPKNLHYFTIVVLPTIVKICMYVLDISLIFQKMCIQITYLIMLFNFF